MERGGEGSCGEENGDVICYTASSMWGDHRRKMSRGKEKGNVLLLMDARSVEGWGIERRG